MTQTQESPTTSERRRVRVWFGQHVIAEYTAVPDLADRYEAAMSRRFAGLKTTNEPVPAAPTSPAAGDPHPLPLPENPSRWPLTAI